MKPELFMFKMTKNLAKQVSKYGSSRLCKEYTIVNENPLTIKDTSACTFDPCSHHLLGTPGARVRLRITFMINIQEYCFLVLHQEENKLSHMTIHSLLRKLAILPVLPPGRHIQRG